MVLQICTWALLCLAAAMSWPAPAHAQDVPRAEVPLTDWTFQPGMQSTEPAADAWVAVKLPYVWVPTWLHPVERKGKAWEKLDLKDLNSGWFETRAAVPAAWQGRRVYLNLAGVQCDAIVWVNGRRLAEVVGPDARVEITPAVTPGRDAQVRLWVTRWWEGVGNSRKADILRDGTVRALASSRWFPGMEAVRKATTGGITDGVSLQAVPAEAEIENVLVAPSYRRKALHLHVDYRVGASLPGARFQVQVSERDGRTQGLPAATIPVQDTSPAPATRRHTLSIAWENPRLWEIGDPYLYVLNVALVDGAGKVIDRYPPVRFGFREVWTEGRNLLLNGHPIRLRLAPFVNDVAQLLFYEGMGFNALEVQPNSNRWYEPSGLFATKPVQAASKELLDAADERGWAVLMPTPGLAHVRDRILEPDATTRYLKDTRAWLRRLDRQNRPSILMWCPSMNTASNLDPALLGRKRAVPPPAWYAKSEELIKSIDPTRLVFHHHGGQTGDMETCNLYPNFMPLQEGEDFLSAWSKGGEKPWGAVEYGHPIFEDFLKIGNLPRFTEYCAIYLGDRAYAAEKDEYVRATLAGLKASAGKEINAFGAADHFVKAGGERVGEWTAYYDLMRLFIRNVHRSWRAYGLNGGAFPWITLRVGFGTPPKDAFARADESLKQRPAWANPMYDAYREVTQPLMVFLGGPRDRFTAKDHNFYAGEEIEKSIVAVWDGPGRKSLKVEWRFLVGEKTLQQGVETIALAPGAIEKRPLRLKVPPVTTRSTGALRLKVFGEDGAPLGEDSLALSLFPAAPAPDAPTARWALYDPAGKTAPELARLGLRPAPFTAGQSLAGVDVLVIGREALRGKTRLPFSLDDVRRGLRVLFCEQEIESLEALGFRVQDVVPRIVFPRARQHPVLAGVRPEDLANWRGEGTLLPTASEGMRVWPYPHAPHCGNTGSVASVVIETPQQGAFTPLLECEFDLAYSPLLEWREGAGSVLFCQLDLTGRIGKEPAADLLARNLIRYLDQGRLPVQQREVLSLGDEKATAFLKALGLQVTTHPEGKPLTLSPATQVVAIGPERLAAMGAHLQELRAFTRAGGVVLVLPQSASQWQAAALPWKLTTAAREVSRLLPEGNAPVLTGIGPQLLHFRTFLQLQAFPQTPAGSARLLEGLLAQVEEGKGRWLFCQVDWRPLFDDSANLQRPRWNITKFYRQLLTNCGARTEESLARQFLSPVRYAPLVDVGPWQVAINPTQIPVDTAKVQDVEGAHIDTRARVALPALGNRLEGDAWLEDPNAPAWRLRATDKNGWLDFTAFTPHQVGKVGYAVTYLYSSTAREANFGLDSDWWFTLKVNGRACVDQSKDGRIPGPPRKGAVRVKVPLQAGWNRLEMKVASGGSGFGFWCQVSDPGDLRVAPTLSAPNYQPGRVPAREDLLAEPIVTAANAFYAEPLSDRDDPYGFCPW